MTFMYKYDHHGRNIERRPFQHPHYRIQHQIFEKASRQFNLGTMWHHEMATGDATIH